METKTILIWDLPLRLFHWLLVIGFIASFVTGKLSGLWLDRHAHAGIFILALVVFRICWGFWGSTHARFSNFFPTPSRMQAFFAHGWTNIGHNPLGALAIFIMLGLTLFQTVCGLFALNDEVDFYGPLYTLVSSTWNKRFTHWHTFNANVLLIAILIHICAIAYYAWLKNINLVTPMVTGKVRMGNRATYLKNCKGRRIFLFVAIGVASTVCWLIESGTLVQYIANTQRPLSSLPLRISG